MNAPAKFLWDGTERRKPHSCRRLADRRCHQERRSDPRTSREASFRRRSSPRSMLTREELADLLK